MKFIFVMGGVISGLGKGITSASIGRLLKSSGYKVNIVKMDPYFQVDAGTMSPYEHGEVFVTDDGAETDLDLGHYERFIDENLKKNSSITTGKIYSTIINKERNGDYLGQTVQVIPHVTNEIKKQLLEQGKDYDFNIVEIGGVIGDIEGPHFTEAIRQLRNDLGGENVFYILVAPLLYVKCSGEFKTKPIQHAYKELTRLGIWADMIICRTESPLSETIKNKISLFCNINKESIIEGLDVETIYQIPILYNKQKVSHIIQKKMGLKTIKEANLVEWNKIVDNYLNSKGKTNILIVGKYTAFQDTYLSVTEALKHAGIKNKVNINIIWVESQDLEKDENNNYLKKLLKEKKLDGVIIPGGFGNRGIEGKIQTVKFCRENNIPFLGLCLGLQIAVIEFARNVCDIKNAHSYEFNIETPNPVIAIMNDQKNIVKKGGTMRLGSYKAILKKGSLTHKIYGNLEIEERHRHRYEVNPRYSQILEDNGLIISGKSPDGDLVEFIELPDHKYFIATQAHPEFKSRIDKPHPLFDGFIKSTIE